MRIHRLSQYVYLLVAVFLLVAIVREARGGTDTINLVAYCVALAISVALFEFRRRTAVGPIGQNQGTEGPDASSPRE